MAFKAGGAPCDLYRENVILNPGNYGAPVCDDYRTNSQINAMPARTGHVPIAPYAANPPVSDNWQEHVRGKRGVDRDPAAIYQQ